jgi:hypothetical protein
MDSVPPGAAAPNIVAICTSTWGCRSVAGRRDHVRPRLATMKHVREHWLSASEQVSRVNPTGPMTEFETPERLKWRHHGEE